MAKNSASPLLVGGVVAVMILVMVAILSLQLGTGRLPTKQSESAPQVEAPNKTVAPIDKEMAAALAAFNPRFKIRKAEDYSPKIRADAATHARHPFMMRLDVNTDGAADVVLDGHDDQRSLLICLLSKSNGYDVVVIRESSVRAPHEVESWNDGVRETGLNYYLWPHGTGTGFTLAFPQQSDPDGTLLSDGGVIDYMFADGAFIQSSQIP